MRFKLMIAEKVFKLYFALFFVKNEKAITPLGPTSFAAIHKRKVLNVLNEWVKRGCHNGSVKCVVILVYDFSKQV